MRRILVTGCGRTGTHYTANFLTLCGFRSRHEMVFGSGFVDMTRQDIERHWPKDAVEVSWRAAPFLGQIPYNTLVLHQVRDPLKSLRCWRGHKMLRPDTATGKFVHRFFPELDEGTDMERAVAYHVLWNRLIEEKAQWRFKIEDLTVDLLEQMVGRDIDANPDINDLSPEMASCGHGKNDHITWEEIAHCPMGGELIKMASRYGYF